MRNLLIASFMDGEVTTFTYTLRSGDVTYLSHGWYAMYAGGPPAYVWHWNHRDVFGSGHRLGETLSFDVALSDGTNYWAVQPTMNVTTTSGFHETPLTCFGEGLWQYCFASTTSFTRKDAFASGGGQ